MEDEFNELWDKYVSIGFDVVVPTNNTDVSAGPVRTNIGGGVAKLPKEYRDVIGHELDKLQKRTGKAIKLLKQGKQYGLKKLETVQNNEAANRGTTSRIQEKERGKIEAGIARTIKP